MSAVDVCRMSIERKRSTEESFCRRSSNGSASGDFFAPIVLFGTNSGFFANSGNELHAVESRDDSNRRPASRRFRTIAVGNRLRIVERARGHDIPDIGDSSADRRGSGLERFHRGGDAASRSGRCFFTNCRIVHARNGGTESRYADRNPGRRTCRRGNENCADQYGFACRQFVPDVYTDRRRSGSGPGLFRTENELCRKISIIRAGDVSPRKVCPDDWFAFEKRSSRFQRYPGLTSGAR